MKIEKIKLKLHVISPTHIGCDEIYEPSGFKIDEKRHKLIEFDKIKFYESLSEIDKRTLLNICLKSDISSFIQLINFIQNKNVSGKEVDIAHSVLENFNRVTNPLNLPPQQFKQELNKLEIKKTASNPYNHQAYIPGSSIKGALRTGYLNFLSEEKNIPIDHKDAKQLEKELLNFTSFDSDPFGLIKISDFIPEGKINTKIIYALNKKKDNTTRARGIPVLLEIIQEGSSFNGTIDFHDIKLKKNSEITNINDLLKESHNFYFSLLQEENSILAKIKASTRISTSIKKDYADKLGTSAFCIRLGRHSGAEAVTIKKYRKINRTSPCSTTIWLASDERNPNLNYSLIPFGWCILEKV